MTQASGRPETAKEQAIRLARMMTASTGVTPIGFAKLCQAILRDSRSSDFLEMYGEHPLPRRPTPNLEA